MKIRTCYVSNSSSSSYCILGREICYMADINSNLKNIDENKKYVIKGINGEEGELLIHLTGKEIIDIFLNRRMDAEWFYCNLVEKIAESYDNEKLEIPNITLNAYCFYGTCDNYTTKIDEFISEYTTI